MGYNKGKYAKAIPKLETRNVGAGLTVYYDSHLDFMILFRFEFSEYLQKTDHPGLYKN